MGLMQKLWDLADKSHKEGDDISAILLTVAGNCVETALFAHGMSPADRAQLLDVDKLIANAVQNAKDIYGD